MSILTAAAGMMISAGSATGGTEVDDGGFRYHTFTSTGNLTVLGTLEVEFLIIGGGGGGGNSGGGGDAGTGGGGAGGYQAGIEMLLLAGVHTATIGAGGAVAVDDAGDTTFNAITSDGGGVGHSQPASGPVSTVGGSGGGGGGTSFNGSDGIVGQGENGGDAGFSGNGGGGGGATTGGEDGGTSGPSRFIGASGGNGNNDLAVWATATGTGDGGYYAGGGSGGGLNATSPAGLGADGEGGGGQGRFDGQDNATGGQDGLVIIRYPI